MDHSSPRHIGYQYEKLLSEDSSDSEVAMNQAGQTTEEKLDAELRKYNLRIEIESPCMS